MIVLSPEMAELAPGIMGLLLAGAALGFARYVRHRRSHR